VDNIIKIFRDNEICILLINKFFFFFFLKKKRKEKRRNVEICMFRDD
jgi:hypothetical protein